MAASIVADSSDTPLSPTLATRREQMSGGPSLVDALVTGRDAGSDRLPLESSRAGVFAVGDVRSASVKRVAAAAGDRALPVSSIHALFQRRQAEHR